MKHLFLSLVFFFSIGSIVAQVTPEAKTNWETISENKDVKISKRVVFVNDVHNGTFMEYVQLKYKNKTAKQLVVNCYVDAKYSNGPAKSNLNDEDYRALLLDPNQTFIPSFSKQNDKMHFIFKRMTNYTDKPTLTTISITKLNTNTLK